MSLKAFATRQLTDSKVSREKRGAELQDKYKKMLAHQVVMKRHLRAATEQEYAEWLQVRYKKFKDVNISTASGLYDFWVATSNLTIYPLMGALSMNIIIPKGITAWHSDGIGHNNLYFHDGSTLPTDCIVYIFDGVLKYL